MAASPTTAAPAEAPQEEAAPKGFFSGLFDRYKTFSESKGEEGKNFFAVIIDFIENMIEQTQTAKQTFDDLGTSEGREKIAKIVAGPVTVAVVEKGAALVAGGVSELNKQAIHAPVIGSGLAKLEAEIGESNFSLAVAEKMQKGIKDSQTQEVVNGAVDKTANSAKAAVLQATNAMSRIFGGHDFNIQNLGTGAPHTLVNAPNASPANTAVAQSGPAVPSRP